MSRATKAVSVRLDSVVLADATSLRPDMRVSEIIGQALRDWVSQQRRKREDELIKRALGNLSEEQLEEERGLATQSGESARRLLEEYDG